MKHPRIPSVPKREKVKEWTPTGVLLPPLWTTVEVQYSDSRHIKMCTGLRKPDGRYGSELGYIWELVGLREATEFFCAPSYVIAWRDRL